MINDRLRRQLENDEFLRNRKAGSPVRRMASVSRLPPRAAPPEERDDLEARVAHVLHAIETSGTVKPRFEPLTMDELEGGGIAADDFVIGGLI